MRRDGSEAEVSISIRLVSHLRKGPDGPDVTHSVPIPSIVDSSVSDSEAAVCNPPILTRVCIQLQLRDAHLSGYIQGHLYTIHIRS